MPVFYRNSKPGHAGSDQQSMSLSSSQSKSIDSSEDYFHSSLGTLSSPEMDRSKQYGSFSSSKSSVPESLSSILEDNDFPVKFLGSILNLVGQAEGSLDLINVIDIAQCEETLPYVATGSDVYLSLNCHGIRVSESNQHNTIHRFPLYLIERIVTFDDGIFNNTVLAVKVAHDGDSSKYDVFAYQCHDEMIGQKVTRIFSHILDSVMSNKNSSLQNMHLETESI